MKKLNWVMLLALTACSSLPKGQGKYVISFTGKENSEDYRSYLCSGDNKKRDITLKAKLIFPTTTNGGPVDQSSRQMREFIQHGRERVKNVFVDLYNKGHRDNGGCVRFDRGYNSAESYSMKDQSLEKVFSSAQMPKRDFYPAMIFESSKGGVDLYLGSPYPYIQSFVYGRGGSEKQKEVLRMPDRCFYAKDELIQNGKIYNVEGYALEGGQFLDKKDTHRVLYPVSVAEFDYFYDHYVLQSSQNKSPSETLKNSKSAWLSYLRSATTVKEAMSQDGKSMLFYVVLDTTLFCKYGRPATDFTSK